MQKATFVNRARRRELRAQRLSPKRSRVSTYARGRARTRGGARARVPAHAPTRARVRAWGRLSASERAREGLRRGDGSPNTRSRASAALSEPEVLLGIHFLVVPLDLRGYRRGRAKTCALNAEVQTRHSDGEMVDRDVAHGFPDGTPTGGELHAPPPPAQPVRIVD